MGLWRRAYGLPNPCQWQKNSNEAKKKKKIKSGKNKICKCVILKINNSSLKRVVICADQNGKR
jgi:ribosomal protein L7Ae-like RNA K-turn-binding protein